VRVKRIGYVGLRTHDVEGMTRFFRDVLGLLQASSEISNVHSHPRDTGAECHQVGVHRPSGAWSNPPSPTGKGVTMAEDAAKVAPHVYKVLFENERARVLEVTMQPGDSTDMHHHPDYFVYFLSDGKAKFTTPSGETDEIEWPAGGSMWREAEEHSTENVGGSAIRALFFEPK
jgi:quercetin dioxygenase-like cupin family protein